MKKVTKYMAIMLIAAFMLVSCSKHVHKVGMGMQGNGEVENRQWYILFGLVSLNDVDTAEMAGDAKDYQIETKQGGLDILMNIFTGYITVSSRTVTVKK